MLSPRLLASVFASLIALPLASRTAPAETSSLVVMSFNVRYANPDDGPNVWERRRDILVETIRRAAPDLIGTQELLFRQGEYIAEKLPEYAWFGVDRRGGRDDEHMGIFYRRDRFFPIETGHFWLSETPRVVGSMSWNVSLPRTAAWARFRDARGGEFYFYNTHFPHRREDAAARLECARVIAADIAARVPTGAAVILAGDFNAPDDSDAHELLTRELSDAWRAAEVRLGPETTWSNWTGEREGRRIDWILFRGPWRVARAETVDYNEAGAYPSDHYPVVARFEPAP